VTIAPPSVTGAGLSPLVAAAVPRAAARVLALVADARADVEPLPGTTK
jgi:hypothetical protein